MLQSLYKTACYNTDLDKQFPYYFTMEFYKGITGK